MTWHSYSHELGLQPPGCPHFGSAAATDDYGLQAQACTAARLRPLVFDVVVLQPQTSSRQCYSHLCCHDMAITKDT